MTDLRALVQRLHDVLRSWTNVSDDEQAVIREAASALTQLLAERAVPPREPIAWYFPIGDHGAIQWGAKRPDYPIDASNWLPLFAAPAAAEPRDADCESCGGSGEAVVYHRGGQYGDREVIKCRDCKGTGLADSTLAEQRYAPFTDAETLAGREATREANAGVECAHGDNAAMPRMASFPPNETLRQQIANDPDDEPSAGDYECTR